MKNNQKRGVSFWWIIIIVAIIVLGILGSILWKGDSDVKNYIQDNIIEPIKDVFSPQDSSSEPLKDDVDSQNASYESSTTSSDDSSGGGGGGSAGGSSNDPRISNNATTQYNTTTLPEDYETFLNLEELFNSENPLGNKVSVQGIALQITGVSTSDSFFFTDDKNVINDITYMLFNKIEYHITVYNSIHVSIPQSIITLTGTIVDCAQNDDGEYCVNAESIE